MKKLLLAAVIGGLLWAAIGGLVWAAVALAHESAVIAVRVTITDKRIALSRKAVPVGKVTFAIQNRGKLVHNFRVGGKTSKAIAPGKKATLIVVFKGAKSWAYLSTLPHGHTQSLNGVFKVHGRSPAAPGNPRLGAAVFSSAGCATCHTLKAAGSKGTVGPNLDQKEPPYALVVSTVTNGKGAMPPFKSTLTGTQIENLAAYIYDSTHH